MSGRVTPADELLEKVRGCVPLLAAEAAEAERLRRPTDAQIRALEDTGVFRMLVPRCHGGLELDLDAFVEVGFALAEADVSIAWVATFCIEHNWMLCQFPESFQKPLYAGGRGFVLAPGVIAPTGRAEPVDGGYRLSGRWRWGTGVMHATWAIVGAVTDADAGPDSLRFLALPMADVKVDDTWFVDGMIATGSNDLVVEDAFVPADRSVSIPDMVLGRAHGAELHAGPLYRTPMLPILMLAASMPIVGRALRVARDFRDHLGGQVRLNTAQVAASRPAAQMRLAQAYIEARQAELLLRDVASEVASLRNLATPVDRGRFAASITHAVHQARRVIQDVAEASGASAHFASHPLQRALRDVNVASCHVAFDRDAQRELYGRLLLGQDPSHPMF
jgi:alkylation response protein AidB-like acyl-CoA dehydrogenase